jgi:hypothetical protein
MRLGDLDRVGELVGQRGHAVGLELTDFHANEHVGQPSAMGDERQDSFSAEAGTASNVDDDV